MKELGDITLIDLLPPNFKYNHHSRALSKAVEAVFGEIVVYSNRVKVYSDITHLNETGLDLLANQWKIKGYTDDLAIENKRRLVKNALLYQLLSGTAKVIQEKVSAVYDDQAEVKEWFEYGGNPYTFRVDIESEMGIDQEKLAEAERLIKANKNARSHLERFKISLRNNTQLYIGAASQTGETIAVYPYMPDNLAGKTTIYLTSWTLGVEQIQVLPKGLV